MIAYVESNFILELAYLQEEHDSCDGIVRLAEAGDITLVLPAFSIAEPYESFVRRYKDRKTLLERLEREIGELARSEPYVTIAERSTAVTGLIVRSLDEEKTRLDGMILRILRCAETIPATAEVMEAAISLQRGAIRSAQDAIVFASVASHLKKAGSEESCFLNKNAGDFNDPDVEGALERHKCKLVARFSAGLGYVRARIARRSE